MTIRNRKEDENIENMNENCSMAASSTTSKRVVKSINLEGEIQKCVSVMTPPSRSSNARRESNSGSDANEKCSVSEPVPLCVNRENSHRKEKSEMNLKERPDMDGRNNLSKRTARLKYSEDFKAEIASQRNQPPHFSKNKNHDVIDGVEIFVRKRPIFDYEIDRGDFDILSVENTNSNEFDMVVANNCVMHSDMRRMFVKTSSFPCTAAFDENCTNNTLYHHVAEPLVKKSVSGGVSTILMFGQTGSGKTYTMTGIEERVSVGLFQALEELCLAEASSTPIVRVQFIELAGKTCRDLLSSSEGVSVVKIANAEDGSVRILNSNQKVVKNPNELAALLTLGKSRRATEATDKNGVSSRSHAICQIEVVGSGTNHKKRGLLTLIDMAGSERRNDSLFHSSERQKESAEINASIWALKECIRNLNSSRTNENVFVPYRSNNLTRILRESFERQDAKLCVIATVAPNATDTEHTSETLKTVLNLAGLENSITEAPPRSVTPVSKTNTKELTPPKQWSKQQLFTWLEKNKFSIETFPNDIDGKSIMRMPLNQMSFRLFDGNAGKASALFKALRVEANNVAKQKLAERKALAKGKN